MIPPGLSTTELKAWKERPLPARLATWLLGFATKRLATKSAALLLAVLLWITVRQEITGTQTFDVKFQPDLEAGLMLTGAEEEWSGTAELQGPVSEIRSLEKLDEIVIRLPVRRDDLGGRDAGVVLFSVSKGNLRLDGADDVEITEIDPKQVTVPIAVREVKAVRVNPPVVILPDEEGWEPKVELLSAEVRIRGPKPYLDDLGAVDLAPIQASEILDRQGRDDVENLTQDLKLADEYQGRHVTLASGEQILCRLTLTRSRVERQFWVPFLILEEPKQDWPVRLVPTGSDELRDGDQGWEIQLRITGTQGDLERIAAILAEGPPQQIFWTFALADEFELYRAGKDGTDYLHPVRIVMPEELRAHVSVVTPDSAELQADTVKREK